MKIKLILAIICCGMMFGSHASAQNVAVKTNTLYWATTTPNLQLEFGLGRQTTLEVGGTYNPFVLNSWTKNDVKFEKKLKHWMVQPEFRWWTCERFNRGFWGIHALGGVFNASGIKMPFGIWERLENNRFEGWMVGGGVSYGYSWYLAPHWNLEATIGAGYIYLDMKRFECGECGQELGKETKHYFGPTKFGLTFTYFFKTKK
ncbi:DUF3575 domain-containing protein [Alistipes sp. OttesenSCG-928-B03]|nr:DUF3575 domain-containing protein [Alistipes sp. OttesenSCG-928-B03]